MADFIALIHKADNSDYGVSFPDFPGCVTAGTTLDDARVMAAEALAFHVDGMIEDGEAIPAPSSLSRIMKERENRDAVAMLVTLADKPHSVRVNITLPDDLLQQIDHHAQTEGYTRSGLLAKAARRLLQSA
jgi:predicted RNase H-like HicB family nuclease